MRQSPVRADVSAFLTWMYYLLNSILSKAYSLVSFVSFVWSFYKGIRNLKNKWNAASGRRQYVILLIPFSAFMLLFFVSPLIISVLLLQNILGYASSNMIGILGGFALYEFLYGRSGMNTVFRRFEYRYLTVRYLWKDLPNRTWHVPEFYSTKRTRAGQFGSSRVLDAKNFCALTFYGLVGSRKTLWDLETYYRQIP